jgi:hypothetical protein
MKNTTHNLGTVKLTIELDIRAIATTTANPAPVATVSVPTIAKGSRRTYRRGVSVITAPVIDQLKALNPGDTIDAGPYLTKTTKRGLQGRLYSHAHRIRKETGQPFVLKLKQGMITRTA